MIDNFYGEAVKTLEILVKSFNGYYFCRDGWSGRKLRLLLDHATGTNNNRRNFKASNAHKLQQIYPTRRKVLPCNRIRERRSSQCPV